MSAQKLPHVAAPTVAVVDDDPDILDLVETMLEMEGHQVITFASTPAALETLRAKSPDLVFLDIKMPEMDGIELLRQLRLKSRVPFIFLTGKLDEVDELLALKLGADDFIRKPFSQRVLAEARANSPAPVSFDRCDRWGRVRRQRDGAGSSAHGPGAPQLQMEGERGGADG